MIMSSRALALFLGSLLLVSWSLQGAALYVVGDVHSNAMAPWLIAGMFIPTLWSVAYLTFFNRKAWTLVRFRPGNPMYLVLAALIPAAIALAALAIAIDQSWGSSSYFSLSANGADVLSGPWLLGRGVQGWGFFVANVASTAVLFACVNGLAAVGEEFGWRGLLQYHIVNRFGFTRGIALLGFVWAIWHLPINLAGYNYPEAPVLGALILFPIELIAVSFIMAWLTLNARSFWPAVLMHGSFNGIEQGVMSSLRLAVHVPPLAPVLVQIAVTVVLALICIVVAPRLER
jgi:membrane protease YdiL (CAAX protease family)